MKELTVESVRINLETDQRVVILKEVEQERYLFIWIANPEAYAIAIELQGTPCIQPLMYETFNNVINALGADIVSVVISKLVDEVYYSYIVFDMAGKHIEVDARPCDAIMLAMRTRKPIYVEENVLDSTGVDLDQEAPLNHYTG